MTGWLGGLMLILAGQPWPLGCLPPAAGAGAVLAWRRWIGDPRILYQLAKDLIRMRKHARKIAEETDGAVERA